MGQLSSLRPRRRRRFTPELRSELVAEFLASGLSQCRFAALRGIAQAQLSRWLAASSAEPRRPPTPTLTPVTIVAETPDVLSPALHSLSAIELVVGRSVTIRLRADFDRTAFADLLSILRESRC